MTYNIIFTGTNLAKPVIEEVKAGLNSIRGTNGNVNIGPSIGTQGLGYVASQGGGSLQPPQSFSTPNLSSLNGQLTAAGQETENLGAAFQNTQQQAYTFAAYTEPQIARVKNGLNVVTYQNQQTGESFQRLSTYGVYGLEQVNQKTQETAQSMTTLNTKSMTAFRSIQMGLLMSVWMSSMFISRQLQEMNSEEAITQATENYNQVVKEKGRNSEEARKALVQVEKAQRNYQAATTLSTLATASMGIQFISLGASLIQYLPTINKAAASFKSLATWQMISSAFSGPYGWAKLAAGIGITGALIGGGLLLANNASQSSQNGSNVNVNVNVQNDTIGAYLQSHGAIKADAIGG
jgi:hypothetical protein